MVREGHRPFRRLLARQDRSGGARRREIPRSRAGHADRRHAGRAHSLCRDGHRAGHCLRRRRGDAAGRRSLLAWRIQRARGARGAGHGRMAAMRMPSWQVTVTDATRQWATLALAGPRSRTVLASAGTDIDLRGEPFPHLHFREGAVADMPARVARVSFCGELQYEINVPAGYAIALWDRLLAAGAAEGMQPSAWKRGCGCGWRRAIRSWASTRTAPRRRMTSARPAGAGRRPTSSAGARLHCRTPHARTAAARRAGGHGRHTALARRGAYPSGGRPLCRHARPSAASRPVRSARPSGARWRWRCSHRGRARTGEAVCAYFGGRRHWANVVALPFYDPAGARVNV